jgi:DNA-binding NtrC family response regulator
MAVGGTVSAAPTVSGDIKEVVAAYERDLIFNALKRCNWNQTKAAEMLNLPRRTLVSKIKKYGIRRT